MAADQNTPRGPFETAEQAFDASVRMRDAIRAVDPGGTMTDTIRAGRRDAAVRYVLGTLDAAGVELGQHDRAIAAWLAAWGPETVTVILDWSLRARLAGLDAAGTWLHDIEGDEGCPTSHSTRLAAIGAAVRAAKAEGWQGTLAWHTLSGWDWLRVFNEASQQWHETGHRVTSIAASGGAE